MRSNLSILSGRAVHTSVCSPGIGESGARARLALRILVQSACERRSATTPSTLDGDPLGEALCAEQSVATSMWQSATRPILMSTLLPWRPEACPGRPLLARQREPASGVRPRRADVTARATKQRRSHLLLEPWLPSKPNKEAKKPLSTNMNCC
jgi:hypothetical protein